MSRQRVQPARALEHDRQKRGQEQRGRNHRERAESNQIVARVFGHDSKASTRSQLRSGAAVKPSRVIPNAARFASLIEHRIAAVRVNHGDEVEALRGKLHSGAPVTAREYTGAVAKVVLAMFGVASPIGSARSSRRRRKKSARNRAT